MISTEKTVEEYLNSLPEERKGAISAVRDVILKSLPKGYEETINWGMISYEVPLDFYPDTYNKKPLMYAAVANQKNHMAFYTMGGYGSPELSEKIRMGFKESGKSLDMGKSCIRFRKLEDLPLNVIADTIAAVPLTKFVENAKSVKRK